MTSLVGQVLIKRYRVDRELRSGGMAVVYLGRDTQLADRPVVVKQPHAGLFDKGEMRKRFRGEIQQLIHREHPAIVDILAQGEAQGLPFYILKYMEGGSLADLLAKGRQTPGPVLAWLDRMSDALDYIHTPWMDELGRESPSLVHRDVKPDNILFTKRGGRLRAYLSDFGIVKALGRAYRKNSGNTVIGTPDFMAPEQNDPMAPIAGAADQYALAGCVYMALTGRPPFFEVAPVARPGIRQLRDPVPVNDPSLAPELPAASAHAVMRALSRDASARFDSCQALAQAFRAGMKSAPEQLPRRSVPPPYEQEASGDTPSQRQTPAATPIETCSECETPNPATAVFCGDCGARLDDECPKCAQPSRKALTYCHACGVVKADYRKAEATLREARACLDAHEYEAARSAAEAGLALNELATPLGDVLREARKILRTLSEFGPVFERHVEEGDLDRAAALLYRSEAIAPGEEAFGEARKRLEAARRTQAIRAQLDVASEALEGGGRFPEALDHCKRALAIDPNDRDALALQSRAEETRRDYLAQLERFGEAIDGRQWARASELAEELERAFPWSLRADEKLAWLAHRARELAAFHEAFKRALSRGDFDAARNLIRRVDAMLPDDPELKGAERRLEVARQQRDIREEVRRARGALDEERDFEGVLAACGRILLHAPEHGDVLDLRARAEAIQAEYAQRSSELRKLLEDEHWAEAQKLASGLARRFPTKQWLSGEAQRLGRYLLCMRRARQALGRSAWKEAIRHLRQAQTHVPSDQGARDLIREARSHVGAFPFVSLGESRRPNRAPGGGRTPEGTKDASERRSTSAAGDHREFLSRIDRRLAGTVCLLVALMIALPILVNRLREPLTTDPPPMTSETVSRGRREMLLSHRRLHRPGKSDWETYASDWIYDFDLRRAIEKALREEKPLLIHYYADWSSFCYEMDEGTLSDSRVRKALQDYVLVKLSVDLITADRARKHKACDGCPVFSFLTPDGETLIRAVGGVKTVEEFLAILSEVKERRAPGAETAAAGSTSPPSQGLAMPQPTTEQEAAARRHRVPPVFENEWGMRFVLIPEGRFLMGSPASEEGHDLDETLHEVMLTKPFYLQLTEVTNRQYRTIVSDHDSRSYEGHPLVGDVHPAVRVSWNDASTFAERLGELDPRRSYRLPTEAEWEYACRAGTTTRYAWGDDAAAGWRQANGNDVVTMTALDFGWEGWPKDDGYRVSGPVGRYPANPWGLLDMHGNVWEWCRDWYDAYANDRATDPAGPSRGERRVLRGGAWNSRPRHVRSACRYALPPEGRVVLNGLRLVSPVNTARIEGPQEPVGSRPLPGREPPILSPEQHAAAKEHGLPVRFENERGMHFVLVPTDVVETIGSPVDEPDRREDEELVGYTPTKPVYVQTTEVTNRMFRLWAEDHRSGEYRGHPLDGDDQPVVNVDIHQALSFVAWLNVRTDGYEYSLPSESLWEYVARAGGTTRFAWGDELRSSYPPANVGDQTLGSAILDWPLDTFPFADGHVVSAPVGTFPPNRWGLYDVAGNVWEWCVVRPRAKREESGAAVVGRGDPNSLLKGGSWTDEPASLRAAYRNRVAGDMKADNVGFRVVARLAGGGG